MICIALTLVGLNGAFAAPRTYTLDPARTVLRVQVFKDASAAFGGMSHDHVIRAGKVQGEVTYDAADPSSCRADIVVSVADLVVDAPEDRKAVGYTVMLDDGDRKTVREHMLAEDQLHGGKHKEIRLRAEACVVEAKGIMMAAQLTLRGKTKPVEIPLTSEVSDTELRARGKFKFTHKAFGIEPYSGFLGGVRNLDGMTLSFDLVARAKP